MSKQTSPFIYIGLFLLLFTSRNVRAQNSTCIYTPYTKSFVGSFCNNTISSSTNNVSLINPDFESGTNGWSFLPNASRASIFNGGYNSAHCVQLNSQNVAAGDAFITQVINNLTPGAAYNLSAMISSNMVTNTNIFSVNMNVRFNYPNGNYTVLSSTFYPTQNWSLAQYPFTVPTTAGLLSTQIQLFVYRGQNKNAFFDDISLISAQSNPTAAPPFSFVNTNNPLAPSGILSENFSGTMGTSLNCDQWLVVKKTWGNNSTLNNNGVVPENLELVCGGGIRFHGHGDLYNGPINGNTTFLGNGKIRVGSCIATKNYYASGLYEVEAKLTPGMVNAFWTFHYIEDAAFQNGGIKNTEIDWEFPSNTISGPKTSIQDGLCNSWGGLCNGEGLHATTSINSGMGDLSTSFHKYKIEWHTGGNGILPSIKWYIDSNLVKTETNASDIPFRASRFWLGVWYGNSNWISGGDPSVYQYSDKFMEVKSVKITPFFEANDIYENETVPSDGFATPNYYPTFPCSPTSARTNHQDQQDFDFTENGNDPFLAVVTEQTINIELITQQQVSITDAFLYSFNGACISHITNSIKAKNIKIPISTNISKGLYLIKVKDEDGQQFTKKITL